MLKKKKKNKISKHIKGILKNLPNTPGVYLMKNDKGEILYVGKAKVLKNRVRQYFQNTKNHSLGTRVMMKHITDIEIIKVTTEIEALMLESTLIKEKKPRYNVRMRDDKNFSYIKISIHEDFPRIFTVRKMINDKAKYFGPYTSTTNVRKILKLLQKVFPYRTCNGEISVIGDTSKSGKDNVKIKGLSKKAPCLDYHIKRCDAPCIGKISSIEYKKMIFQIIKFLNGNHEGLIKGLKTQMESFSKERKYESAGKIRDKILAISGMMEKQKMISTSLADQDVLNVMRYDKKKAFVNILEIRAGKLIDVKNFEIYVASDSNKEEILEKFIPQYYELVLSLPKEIIIDEKLNAEKAIIEWFSHELEKKVTFTTPKSGTKKDLLNLGLKNANQYKEKLDFSWDLSGKLKEAMADIVKNFELREDPKRIECYDISHLGGTETTGSMVVFENGKMQNSSYRKFKINSVNTPNKPDDYKSMNELIKRRLKHLAPCRDFVYNVRARKARIKEKSAILKILKMEKFDYRKINLEQVYILAIDKKIKGICRMREIKDYIELSSFWIEKKSRGKGYGSFFVEKVLNKFKKSKVYVVAKESSKEFFLHNGFVEVSKIKPDLRRKMKKMCSAIKTSILMWQFKKSKIDKSLAKKPDILFIDGGKGQLLTVYKVVKTLKLDIKIISLAKKENIFYMSNSKKEIRFLPGSEAEYLLERIRDEAHRFANVYRENLGLKKMTKSILDSISGIGPNAKNKLLKEFCSVKGIKNASIDEISKVIGDKKAILVKENL